VAAKKLRVHIENTRNKAGIFHTLPAHWAAACARHRALARHIGDVSFGWDGDVLESALGDADLVIGVPARRNNLASVHRGCGGCTPPRPASTACCPSIGCRAA